MKCTYIPFSLQDVEMKVDAHADGVLFRPSMGQFVPPDRFHTRNPQQFRSQHVHNGPLIGVSCLCIFCFRK
jgi:hypothetical protein